MTLVLLAPRGHVPPGDLLELSKFPTHLSPYDEVLPGHGLTGADVLVELEAPVGPPVDAWAGPAGVVSHGSKQTHGGYLKNLDVVRLGAGEDVLVIVHIV